MKLATWNVNSVRARLERVTAWIKKHQPDVLCLQELKTEEKDFPAQAFKDLGYHSVQACQRTYNGVAILSRTPAQQSLCGLGDGVDDTQARLVSALVEGVHVLCAYVPNGQEVGSDKYAYKLEWLKRLRTYLEKHHQPDQPVVLCGDFNVAPEERDVHAPDQWSHEPLFHEDARKAMEHVRQWGFTDAFRLHHAEPGLYSWWDYRALAFPKNRGLRIDHIWITQPLVGRCKDVVIDREARKGQQPSDHAPVVATFE